MNSIHDLGGMHGMGPIVLDVNEPKFAEDWEARTCGFHLLTLMTGIAVADEARHSMERIPALHWLASPYYEHWLDGTATYFLEKGIATSEELATGKAQAPLPEWAAKLKALTPEETAKMFTTNHPVTGEAETEPKFAVGDKAMTLNINPKTHTRLPRYTRGKPCTIVAYRGACFYADARSVGDYGAVDHTYTVRFEGADLWGRDAGAKDAVYIDLYEQYLEAM
ncbi:nitrile hydratase subunit beta [Thioclava sp. GXIMD2076]|uniref:Nitrile hydratase subunit beta n=1 Tax=Thioclava kandeliae TaxID=3070818 RepID=A0ABV1SDZ4_9RHOB